MYHEKGKTRGIHMERGNEEDKMATIGSLCSLEKEEELCVSGRRFLTSMFIKNFYML